MRLIRIFFNGSHLVMVVLAKILLAGMALVISANVFFRYVLNSGLRWSEEIALVLVVWFTFIAMAMGVKNRLHIHLNILPDNLPRPLEFLLSRFRNLIILFSAFVFLYYGIILTQFTMKSILPATGLPAGIMYIVMPIASIPMIYDSLMELFGFEKDDENLRSRLGGEGETHA